MATYALGKIGMNLRGTYDASATYHKLDVVTYNGSSYAALQVCTGVPVTNAEYWQMLCAGNAESYTTNEVCTGGTWIDGKPIYRRVFYAENAAGTGHTFPDTIEGLETVVSITGMFSNAHHHWLIPYAVDGAWSRVCFEVGTKKVKFETSGGFVIDKLEIVVDYTKGE